MIHRNHCILNVMHRSRELAVYCYNLMMTFHQLLRMGFLQTLDQFPMLQKVSVAEQNYTNIECELLAVFAIETFKHFTYGRLTNIITDHKPLTSLFTKCLANTSPRLSRMLLCICDCNTNVLYQKGSKMYLSDALFRLSLHNTKQGKQTEIKGLNISVHDVETCERLNP